MRKTAKELGISKASMHKVFKDDLEPTAYKKQSKQLKSEALIKKRVERRKLILEEIKRTTDTVFIYSNEKIFTVEAVLNRHNDRIYACSAKDLRKTVEVSCVMLNQLG